VLRFNGHEKELFGGEAQTTNNRMELTAVISGLQVLKRRCTVDVTTDSQYVKNGITQWISNWKRNGWRTAARKPVKNDDLWRLLDEVVSRHDVSWHWVKGHSGHPENERADALANRGIEQVSGSP
jgi:ribonuclease HI